MDGGDTESEPDPAKEDSGVQRQQRRIHWEITEVAWMVVPDAEVDATKGFQYNCKCSRGVPVQWPLYQQGCHLERPVTCPFALHIENSCCNATKAGHRCATSLCSPPAAFPMFPQMLAAGMTLKETQFPSSCGSLVQYLTGKRMGE